MHLCLLLSVLLSQFAFSVSQNPVYHFINKIKSWSEARQYCRKYYTDLATVNNMTDLEKLKQVANGCTDAWIGLYQKSNNLSDREWHWSQPGVKYNESEAEWGETDSKQEPTDQGKDDETRENCVVVNKNGQWVDSNCMGDNWFICYNESSSTTHLIDVEKNWLDAQSYCRTQHTDLISGWDQLDMADDMIGNAVVGVEEKWRWIGLFRDTWGWSDGSDSSFRIWDEWENVLDMNPDKITEKCATLGKMGELDCVSCEEKNSFICYDERFILVRENKTWEEALIHCRRHHLDLAWHNGPHQGRMVRQRAKMADSEVVWLGLHFTCFFEEWMWVNGHYVPHDDENWKDHRNNKCEVSGAMEKGGRNKWVKRPSEQKHNFICVQKY